MATQQDINDAVSLNTIRNARAYGYDSIVAKRRDDAQWNALGGDARLNQLMSDPQVNQYISAGSGNSLVSTAKTFGPYIAAGAGLAGLAGLAGMPITMSGSTLGGAAAAGGGGLMAAPGSAGDVIASMGGAGGGATGAMETAGALSAAGAPSVAGAGMTNAEIAAALEAGQYGGMTGALTPAEIAAAGGAAGSGSLTSGLSSLVPGGSNTLGSLVSAGTALYGAQQGVNATNDATSELRRQFDIGQTNAAPWLEAGKKALTEQQNLMGLGSGGYEAQLASLMSSPGYQFRFDEGKNALERSAAAKGMLGSGNVMAALTKYGQDYASNEYGNRLNQLAGVSGTGQTQANQNMTAGMNYAGDIGNAALTAGGYRQSGIVGAGKALSDWINPQPKQTSLAELLKGVY